MGTDGYLVRFVLASAFSMLAACDEPFEPLQPTDLAFSIYGHLEAAADTTILHGGVTSSCDQSPISGAMVTLEGGTAGRRQYSTSASGGFRFGGLDPGVAYTLTVTRTGYFDYESEPLTFGEAAVDTVAIAMDWRQC